MLRSGTRHVRLCISRNLDHGQVRQARTATQHIPSNGLVFAGGRVLLPDAKRERSESATHRILRVLVWCILWPR
jgi:hypothetical protein